MRERTEVTKRGIMHVLGRIATLYIILPFRRDSIVRDFGMLPLNNLPLLAEMLVVGTYVTMAGAVAFLAHLSGTFFFFFCFSFVFSLFFLFQFFSVSCYRKLFIHINI